MDTTPTFKVITRKEAMTRRKPRPKHRSWTELVTQIADTVTTKKAVFVPADQVGYADVKYLSLALKRRGRGEMLRTQPEVLDGVEGRLLWAEIA